MATQLWCCDFGCGFQDESRRRVEQHEECCDLNPNNDNIEEEVTEKVLTANDMIKKGIRYYGKTFHNDHNEESRGFTQTDNEG